MSKYYAKEVAPEQFDYELYYNEDMAKDDQFWAGGNPEYVEINGDLRDDLIQKIEETYEELVEEESHDTSARREIIDAHFKGLTSDLDRDKIFNLIMEHQEEDNINPVLRDILSILYKKEFKAGTLIGSPQGEWINYICPKDLDTKYIEAILFNKGTEIMISKDKLDSLDELDDSSTEVSYDYILDWNPKEIKEKIAKDKGCSPEDIALYRISKTRRVTVNDYEEV